MARLEPEDPDPGIGPAEAAELVGRGAVLVDLDGGAVAWVEAGLPLETDDGGGGRAA